MKTFISAAWSDHRANYNTYEWENETDATAAVEQMRRNLEKQGFEPVGFTVTPGNKYTSSCKSYHYRSVRNGVIEIHSCGYWSQDVSDSDHNPGHCEAAYLGVS